MSTKARVSQGLGALVLAAGALLAVVPGAHAATSGAIDAGSGALPAPPAPVLKSAVAAAPDGNGGYLQVVVDASATPSNYDFEYLEVYADGVPLGHYDRTFDGKMVFSICAGIYPQPELQCISQERADALHMGSMITVTETAGLAGPPLRYSEKSAPSNGIRVTVG